MNADRPLLAFTMGDPAGIGPEILVQAWRRDALHAACRGVVVGSGAVLRRAAGRFAPGLDVVAAGSPETDGNMSSRDVLPCLDGVSSDAADVVPAVVDRRGGQAAYDALREATGLARAGRVAAIVTAPLHKGALRAAGHDVPGHTELLAEFCGVRDVAMMLYLPPGEGVRGAGGLGVAHVTLHVALRDIFEGITIRSVVGRIRLANQLMRRLLPPGSRAPRIGVCALNPHAGELGLFGDEERTTIGPAVLAARTEGHDVHGPLPADTLLVRAAEGIYDAVVAMYHDQGHVALKLLGMHRAVNITLGLPIIRTSVAHGTAFDRAWQGTACCDGLIAAARVAAQLARSPAPSAGHDGGR
ncbi:MAG: 4-hydroxythreonine-4-phosphate dehydrogenase PdxA [Planctomycetes bacterium]|nr:4-hydroxythreonine-4-phosphate dehydrogenase PdxA [Planctomycetota bacterium]